MSLTDKKKPEISRRLSTETVDNSAIRHRRGGGEIPAGLGPFVIPRGGTTLG